MSRLRVAGVLLAGSILALGAWAFGQAAPLDKNAPADKKASPRPSKTALRDVRLRGQVVPFREAISRRIDVPLVEKWGADLLVLQADDGRIYSLLPTETARFFYQDDQMLRRPMELGARLVEQAQTLDLIDVHSIKDGKLQDIYYWCEICAIKRFQKKTCECCQGPVEVREHPVGEPFRFK